MRPRLAADRCSNARAGRVHRWGRNHDHQIHSERKGNPAGKLADAELHFSGGPLDGLKLVGFGVWERKQGGRNVTFPARQYR